MIGSCCSATKTSVSWACDKFDGAVVSQTKIATKATGADLLTTSSKMWQILLQVQDKVRIVCVQVSCMAECPACRTPAQQQAILEVISEHNTQGQNWTRIYPMPENLKQPVAEYGIPWQPVGDMNALLGIWIAKACKLDKSWC